MSPKDKPDPDKDILHYGVKGMRWGVRKEEVTTGGSSRGAAEKPGATGPTSEKYLQILKDTPKPSPTEQAKNIVESKKKFSQQFDANPPVKDGPNPKVDKGKGWRPTGTQVAVVAFGAAYVGLTIYGHQQQKKMGVDGNLLLSGKYAFPRPGAKVTPGEFMTAVAASESQFWGTGYGMEEAFSRPAFSIPSGTLFHRLSRHDESEWGDGGTYMTHTVADFHRYIFGFGEMEKGGAVGLHHVTAKATSEIRVPDLTTTLNAMQKAMSGGILGSKATDTDEDAKAALFMYKSLSGGGWSEKDPTVSRFFKELKKQGYSAIVDEMDAGIIGETPLVVFNPASFGKKSASKLTAKDVIHAGENLTELLHRKGQRS